MKITRKNYEECLIDWLDNNLTVEQIDDLRFFLRENPDLKEEFNGIDKIQLNPNELPEVDFSALKKSIFDQPDVFEDTCIRSLERTLNNNEETRLQAYLQNNSKAAHEYKLFKATLLKPDETICYNNINSLKRSSVLSVHIYRIAAAVVFLFSFFWWHHNDVSSLTIPNNQIVALSEKPNPELVIEDYKPELLIDNSVSFSELQTAKTILPREDYSDMKLLVSQAIYIPASETYSKTIEINITNTNTSVPSQKQGYPTIIEFITEKIDVEKNKNKFAAFTLSKIKKASNDKFDYSTTREGNVEKIEFNTKILAFTIPVN